MTGVAAYLIFAYLMLNLVPAFFTSSILLLVNSRDFRDPEFDIVVVLVGAAFLAAVYWALHRLQPAKLRLSGHRGTPGFDRLFGGVVASSVAPGRRGDRDCAFSVTSVLSRLKKRSRLRF